MDHMWKKSIDFDQELREKFASDWAKAQCGDYAQWESDPKGCLALIVLLDQMSRNIFRNNAGAFLSDKHGILK